DKGADVTHGDLLHCAAERKNQSEGAGFAKDLANRGADVNAYRHDKSVARILRGMSQLLTPLHVACYKQNVPVARVLLQHGANPDQMSLKAGQLAPPTALEIAQTKNNEELISLLSTFRT
ncbi:MAG TPA: ankyrin repeat domain-containing protein, partial [Ktedonobacteraceae bacterium]|nr:ankyrin repeat domain-containing protein [Ktedonobacteraceae bacterium]